MEEDFIVLKNVFMKEKMIKTKYSINANIATKDFLHIKAIEENFVVIDVLKKIELENQAGIKIKFILKKEVLDIKTPMVILL